MGSVAFVAWAVHMVVYHGLGLAFEWCDRSGRFRRLKVRAPDRYGYFDLLPRVLANQCFVLLPCALALENLKLAYVGPARFEPIRYLLILAALAVGHDVVFYGAHRFLLHDPRLRWLRHDIHHSTTANKAISACFMGPADFFLEIVCPYLVPLVLVGGGGSDPVFHAFVMSASAVGGLYEHSGYDLAPAFKDPSGRRRRGWRALLAKLPPSLISSHAHGQHHLCCNVSYSDGFGSPGLCDWIFGTRWDLQSRAAR